MYLNQTVTQLKGKNEIRVKINSVSHVLYPNLVKYYFIINMENDYGVLFSLISGDKKPDKNKFEFMTCVEDDGVNEIFQIDIKIDINLKEFPGIFCIPVNTKTNLFEMRYYDYTYFTSEYLSFYERNKILILSVVISIILLLLLLIIIIIILIICYSRDGKNLLKI